MPSLGDVPKALPKTMAISLSVRIGGQLSKTAYKMNRIFQLTALLLLLLTSCTTSNSKSDLLQNENKQIVFDKTPNSKTESLRKIIEQIVSDKNAVVGVSLIGNNGIDTLSLNGDKRFPMQSVFKFHIALAVLSEVDKGTLSLDQTVEIGKDELLPENFWSPLRDENPNGGIFTIKRLIQYNVSYSDNTACDVLIQLIGTPKTVESYLKKSGIEDIQLIFNEEEMQEKWENMFQNWTTPNAASQTLKLFFENKNNLLSKSSYDFFWKTNTDTKTAG
ncbi:MAG: class A beta-lactamase [Aureispira sp.]